MNIAPFFRKWMQDMADGMMKNGVVPAVVPYVALDLMYKNTAASVGWGDAAVLLPYRYWKRYGDVKLMDEYYEKIAKPYGMFMISHTGHTDKKSVRENPLNEFVYEKGTQLGEWLEPEEFNDKVSAGHQAKQTEVATAYFHYSMTLLEEMATALGKEDEAKLFEKNAKGSKAAYHALFLKDGAPDTDRQAKLVRPLALGLVEGNASLKRDIGERLAKAVENRDYHVGTGFLSTPFILPVLTENGFIEHAYKMLENEQAPGWIYEVDQGATTIWENWEGSASHNHYSPGAVCQWLFDTAAGIRVDSENHFVIAPQPGGSLTDLYCKHDSLYGTVESSWKKEGDSIDFTVKIPSNTTAEIRLPNGMKQEVVSGGYSFRIRS